MQLGERVAKFATVGTRGDKRHELATARNARDEGARIARDAADYVEQRSVIFGEELRAPGMEKERVRVRELRAEAIHEIDVLAHLAELRCESANGGEGRSCNDCGRRHGRDN